MNRGSDQYVVRFPEGMRDKIKAMAKANRRSMNAEIVVALDERLLTTTGAGFADTTPAVVSDTAALQGGVSHHQP